MTADELRSRLHDLEIVIALLLADDVAALESEDGSAS